MARWASSGPNATGSLSTNMAKFNAGRPFAFFGADQNPETAIYFHQPLSTIPAVAEWLRSTGQTGRMTEVNSFATNEFVTPEVMHPSV